MCRRYAGCNRTRVAGPLAQRWGHKRRGWPHTHIYRKIDDRNGKRLCVDAKFQWGKRKRRADGWTEIRKPIWNLSNPSRIYRIAVRLQLVICNWQYDMVVHLPVYSGKQIVNGLLRIFSSKRSFLFKNRIIDVSVNHLLLQIESNNLRDSCIRFCEMNN